MKISLVTFSGGRQAKELSGPEGSVPALARALVEQGHEVALHTRASGVPTPATDQAFDTRELPAGPEQSLHEDELFGHLGEFAGELTRQLRDQRPDVVHSHGWLAGLATELAERPLGIPVVHTFHTSRLLDCEAGASRARGAGGERLRVERAVALRADQLLAASTMEQELLVGSGVPRNRVSVVPPGVRTSPEQPAPHPPSEQDRTRRLAILGDARNVVPAVRALVAVPDAEAVVAPTDESEGQLERLRELIGRLALSARVSVRDSVNGHDRVALLRDVDVAVCLPSDCVPSGDHLRAMALGVPVVAGSPEIAEAVVDGTTGIHVLTSNPRVLARVLRGLLDDAPMRYAMGVAGWDRACSRYNWDRIASETARGYECTARNAEARRQLSQPA